MNDKLTPDQFAELIRKTKPYLIAIEERCTTVQNGSLELRLEVHNGVVDKITFYEGRHWLRRKAEESA